MICVPCRSSSGSSPAGGSPRKTSSTENLIAMEEFSPFIASVDACGGGSGKDGGGGGGSISSKLMRLSTVTVAALLGQQFFSSLLWNRYMHGFHEILEVPYKVIGRGGLWIYSCQE